MLLLPSFGKGVNNFPKDPVFFLGQCLHEWAGNLSEVAVMEFV